MVRSKRVSADRREPVPGRPACWSLTRSPKRRRMPISVKAPLARSPCHGGDEPHLAAHADHDIEHLVIEQSGRNLTQKYAGPERGNDNSILGLGFPRDACPQRARRRIACDPQPGLRRSPRPLDEMVDRRRSEISHRQHVHPPHTPLAGREHPAATNQNGDRPLPHRAPVPAGAAAPAAAAVGSAGGASAAAVAEPSVLVAAGASAQLAG
jgi:hypothetical protein